MIRRVALWMLCIPVFVVTTIYARDPAREAELEKRLQAINPALVAPFQEASKAIDRDALPEATALLKTVVDGAPHFDAGLRRYGWCLIRTGDRRSGLVRLRAAVALDRNADNLGTYAAALGGIVGGEPTRAEQAEAMSLLEEARKLPGGDDLDNLYSLAHLGFQLGQIEVARSASEELLRKHPGEMPTHYVAAIIAAHDEHWVRAEREIRKAGELGLPAESMQSFLDSGVGWRAKGWRIAGFTGIAVGSWAGGLLLLTVVGMALSYTTLRHVDRADPNVPVSEAENRLRSIYRWVVNIAGGYYYISLPVVIIMVVGAGGALVMGLLMLGWLPIKLLIIVCIAAFATLWSMGRSLFLKVPTEDPGRALTRAEAEGLWQLTDEVARDLQTKPIGEIRITPGTDLCVYERGTRRQKMHNEATRVLVIGAAVLHDFKQEDFRSVLAHEYGHFSNRDTAGGEVAMRVHNDMMKFYIAMVQAGQATWSNIAFHFLRIYHFVFRRITHGATRLQEVLADRVAAQAYGPAAFEGGLRHVIRQGITFDQRADAEIEAAIKDRRPLQNFYDGGPVDPNAVGPAFEEAVNRPTTPDDTHPGPRDRFRLIARIPAPARPPREGLVWDLFANKEAIIQEMLQLVEKNIAEHRT